MERVKTNKCSWFALWPQWIAVFEVFLLTLMWGTNNGYTSPLLSKLRRPNPPVEATKEEETWIASLTYLSRPIGIFFGLTINNYFGSKLAVYLCGFFYLIGWACFLVANSITVVYTSFILNGIGSGSVSTVFPLYIGEIADCRIRGRLVAFAMNGFSMGLLVGNILGTEYDMWICGVINLIITLNFLGTFIFFPNTPHYLIYHGKIGEAENAIKWYHRDVNVTEELEKSKKFLESNPRLSLMEALRKFDTKINRSILTMILVTYSIVQFSGVFTILQYLEIIVTDAKVTIINPAYIVMIASTIGIVASWSAIYTADRFGRKTMLITSCSLYCLALIGLGSNFQLLDAGYNLSNLEWLVIASVVVYRISVTIGLLPTVPALISEMFPPNVKIIGAAICNIAAALIQATSLKTFQYLVDAITYKYVFYSFAVLVLLVGIYVKIFIPETKGKTLQEIHEMLSKNNDVEDECSSRRIRGKRCYVVSENTEL